jgi:hypothetical protein
MLIFFAHIFIYIQLVLLPLHRQVGGWGVRRVIHRRPERISMLQRILIEKSEIGFSANIPFSSAPPHHQSRRPFSELTITTILQAMVDLSAKYELLNT